MIKEYLLIPGPTPVPQAVTQAMATEMFNHRGPRFRELQEKLTASLKEVFMTGGRLFILTTSGTGAMEAAVVNFLSPGDPVLSLVNGAFGDRLARIAETYGASVQRLEADWGKPLDYGSLEAALRADSEGRIKAVTVVHNESSTGMMNDVECISRLRGDHPALLIVDTVSSMGAVPFPVDEWRVDICLTGSQKALMMPPGLAILSVSDRAWEANAAAQMKSFFFNLRAAEEFRAKGQTPFTPALPQMVAAQTALDIYFREGRERCHARHRRMAGAVRAAALALGLELLVEDRYASMTVTAIIAPNGLNIPALSSAMRERFGVVIAEGQGKLSSRTFRIGHLGAVVEMDIIAGIAALEMAMRMQGYPVELGSGVRAAQEVLLSG